jgi:cob(I)alamin adenosyltransferase
MAWAKPPTTPPPIGRLTAPSLVIVNTGDGKGKTTAAIGIVVRAVARGWRVCVVQFVKAAGWRTGEEAVARRLGVEWRTTGDGFTWDAEDLERSAELSREAWTGAREAIGSGAFDLVVLDEVTYPVGWGWIDPDDVVSTIRERPERVNIVITGREASDALLDLADTVTEMRNVRHAFDRGVRARRGIDF